MSAPLPTDDTAAHRAAVGPATGPTGRPGVPRWALALAMVALLVVAAIVAGPPDTAIPLDPTSTAPSGLKGVRDVLERVDVRTDVSLDPPSDMSTKVFVALDLLGDERREAMLDWVQDGGTLVVADPSSPLHGLDPAGGTFAGVFGSTPRAPECDLASLATVGDVVHAAWNGLEVPAEATGCFPAGDEEGAWLVARTEGRGVIVALGSADPFTNGQLDRADNAVLAAALLGQAPGEQVRFVPRPPVGEGDTALIDLVPTRFWRGLLVLGVGLLLGLLWRGRRLGLPVAERLPPVVPAAELARSVAGLLQRARSRRGAAQLLRAGTRRAVADRLGAGRDTAPEGLVTLVTARAGVDPQVARVALLDTPVPDDETLVSVARAADEVRRAVTAGGAHAAAADPRDHEQAHRQDDVSTDR